ncbi:MAG: type-F conjugative transfer system pilin assembly protein TrbC [Burkholderiaceae bacterium]|nr:type-F conjugative transfer system pilin assembly protein TrbC [Burkholderiaceae bacterium]
MSATEHRAGLASLLALLLSLTCPLAAHAQAPKSPVTEADIARAARSQPTITDKDMEAAARKNRMPTEAELARVPVPATPRIDALPQPQTQRKIDLGAIASGYDAMGQPDPSKATLPVGPTLLVFVSFSMPEKALDRLVDQAARTGATLVLRGFVDDSLQKTVARVQRVIGTRKVGFQIDPQAFDRFSITATPSFVLIRDGAVPAPCAAGTCFDNSSYVLTAGDVSVDYALRFIQRSAPKFAREADNYLSKLKGG